MKMNRILPGFWGKLIGVILGDPQREDLMAPNVETVTGASGSVAGTYAVFVYNETKKRDIPQDAPVKMSVFDIIEELKSLPPFNDGSFLGVIDSQDRTLQFAYVENGILVIDVPQPEKQGSYSKQGDLQEAIRILSSLGDVIHPENISGLSFQPW